MKTQLKLGKKQIARNLNNYRMAEPTEEFWAEWKENKTALKAEGVSVFKRGEDFYIAVYDGTKSTIKEYEQQQSNNFKELKRVFIGEIAGCEHAYQRDIDDAINIIERAMNYESFEPLRYLLSNLDYILAEVEDICFRHLLNA